MTSYLKMRSLRLILLFSLIMLVTCPAAHAGAESKKGPIGEDTMLMFVGEDLEVLAIASRRVESALQAPAIAQVITGKEIRERGYTTLSQALDNIPGFYMAQKEWGTLPYLRGISNSILFLHDTVPLTSDVNKSLHPLDNELSLYSVKRIETIRGPGSVLWGPDAFAGIVNVVPMSGKDIEGLETGIVYGEPGTQAGVYVNAGHDGGNWDGFLSASARKGEEDDTPYTLVSFWGDGTTPTPPDDRYGWGTPGKARHIEAYGRLAYKDWLMLSSRVGDSKKPYTMSNENKDSIWQESRNTNSGYIKLDARKVFAGDSTLSATAIYSWLNPEFEVIDRSLSQKEKTAYAEILYDRSFFSSRGLLSAGVSFREKEIKDSPIWDGYLLDFLDPDNEFFLPIVSQQDYTTRLWSAFGQYTHKIGNADLMVGLRNDAHDKYQDHVSYNLGVVWSPYVQWKTKLLYGTAYRTPFARQLLATEEPELEKIKSFNLQVTWNPSRRNGVSVTGFSNHIENHINEDPYAGLSEPNKQKVNGVEIEARYSPHTTLDLAADVTFMNNTGPDETYKYNDYSYIDEDGNLVRHFVDLSYPYDIGANPLFNFKATWRPHDQFTGFFRLYYFSPPDLIFPVATDSQTAGVAYPDVWLVDLAATLQDIFHSGAELSISIKNLLDNDYQIPGTYSTIDGAPLTFEVRLSKKW
ncbi:TonB-dependent receptor plug domain-containing protein [Thermodesulfobacteriota bacterium]